MTIALVAIAAAFGLALVVVALACATCVARIVKLEAHIDATNRTLSACSNTLTRMLFEIGARTTASERDAADVHLLLAEMTSMLSEHSRRLHALEAEHPKGPFRG